MYFTDEELSNMTGVETTLGERENWPSETLFAQTPFPNFSPKVQRAREEVILSACREADVITTADKDKALVKEYSVAPTAWLVGPKEKGDWSDRAYDLGEKYFGDSFYGYVQNPVRVTRAIIFPNSPYLNLENYRKVSTDLEKTREFEKTEQTLYTLRKVAHILFSFSPEAKKDVKIAFLSEALADGFSINAYLDLDGDRAHVKDFIRARRLYAFLGVTPPTAGACEAALCKKPFPSYAEAVSPLRKLQVLAAVNLCGKDQHLKEETNSKLKSLAHVLSRKNNLSPSETSVGVETLKAYEHFCPTEAQEVFRRCGIAEINQPSGLTC
jgi:hypothetical protein